MPAGMVPVGLDAALGGVEGLEVDAVEPAEVTGVEVVVVVVDAVVDVEG